MRYALKSGEKQATNASISCSLYALNCAATGNSGDINFSPLYVYIHRILCLNNQAIYLGLCVFSSTKKQDRPLTNSESNHIKDDYIDKLMKEREAVAKQARAEKKKNKFKPDASTTYEWSANTNLRGRR